MPKQQFICIEKAKQFYEKKQLQRDNIYRIRESKTPHKKNHSQFE